MTPRKRGHTPIIWGNGSILLRVMETPGTSTYVDIARLGTEPTGGMLTDGTHQAPTLNRLKANKYRKYYGAPPLGRERRAPAPGRGPPALGAHFFRF